MAWSEDFSVFFDDLDTVDATIGAGTVTGYLDDEYVEVDNMTGVMPVFTCATDDVLSVGQDDSVVASGTNYAVITNEPDGTGISKLILRTTD